MDHSPRPPLQPRSQPTETTKIARVCEAVWSCQDGQSTLDCLQILSSALESERVEAYDPSEVFLAIQGAALRFRTSVEDDVSPEDRELSEKIKEHTMLSASVLARVCVGPAWWKQLIDRRSRLQAHRARYDEEAASFGDSNHSGTPRSSPAHTLTAPMHLVHADTASARSWSPISQPSTNDGGNNQLRSYPVVPELLQAAMIRFAASMSVAEGEQRSVVLIESQMCLTLALALRPEATSSQEWVASSLAAAQDTWLIPGVHEPIASMVRSWFRVALHDNSYVSLEVTRACNDLFAGGWRPRKDVCTPIVQDLLELAARGVGALNLNSQEQDSMVMLVSRGAEAVSALSALGARGLIPVDAVPLVTQSVCRLLLGVGERASTNHDGEDIVAFLSTQREAYESDMHDLLWSLLESDCTAGCCMHLLLETIGSVSFSSPQCALPKDISLWKADQMASFALAQTCLWFSSAALFGNPPERASVDLLRVYWHRSLSLWLRSLSEWYMFLMGAQEATGYCECLDSLCDLVVETLSSLGRAIESEIRRGSGHLSEIEWEAMIKSLGASIIPWLTAGDEIGSAKMSGTRAAAFSCISLLCDFLDHCIRVETVPFVEYHLQRQLYTTLLQLVAPHLPVEQARLLGESVVRCWTKFGLFPYHLEGWNQVASDLLNEVFLTDKAGRYFQCSSVRLEALNLLAAPTSDPDDSMLGARPLLTLTEHMREQHLALIRSSIIPILEQVLVRHPLASSGCVCPSLTGCSLDVNDVSDPEAQVIAERMGGTMCFTSPCCDDAALILYSIDLVGRLYRGKSGDRELRTLLVKILVSVARGKCLVPECGCQSGASKPSRLLQARIAATLELERCLQAVFGPLSHAHESIPSLIGALCAIFDDCTTSVQDGPHSAACRAILAVAALDPLTRLRVAIDRHVAFRPRKADLCTAKELLSEFFLATVKAYRSAVVESRGVPCLELFDGETQHLRAIGTTAVSFDGILSSILKYLQASPSGPLEPFSALSFTYKCLRIHCFDIMRHQFLASVPVVVPEPVARLVFAHQKVLGQLDKYEAMTRSLALVKCAENALILARLGEPVLSSKQLPTRSYVEFMVEFVSTLFESAHDAERDAGCIAVSSLLPGLCTLDEEHGTLFITSLLNSLERQALHESAALNKQQIGTLLTVLHDLVFTKMGRTVPGPVLLCLFKFCYQFMSNTICLDNDHCCSLAVRCATGLLDRMSPEELVRAREIHAERRGRGARDHALGCLIDSLIRLEDEKLRVSSCGKASWSMHHQLSTELVHIEGFKCNEFGFSDCSTWYFDSGLLLTCRLGAYGSRSQGFIEVVARTAVEKHRWLIRIPGVVSLLSPDEDHPSLDDNRNVQSAVKGDYEPTQLANDAAARAAAILARFDTVMSESVEFGSATNGLSPSRTTPEMEYAVEEDLDTTSVRAWLGMAVGGDKNIVTVLNERLTNHLASVGELLGEVSCSHPVRLKPGEGLDRAIMVLDRTPIPNTHKIALIYDQTALPSGPDVDVETRLLSPTKCSPAFYAFTEQIGQVVPIQALRYYSGGLDTSSYKSDGDWALVWTDRSELRSMAAATSIVFHTVSMMPGDGPSRRINRKRHVGNDFVLILFADRGSDAIVDYDLLGGELIGGAFGFVVIWVTVPRPGVYRVNVRVRKHEHNEALNKTLATFVSDNAIAAQDAPTFVRNIAMRADLACRALLDSADAPCNYLYRFQLIQDIQRFVIN